jgi:hypothetical protein
MVDASLKTLSGIIPFVSFDLFAGEESFDFLCARLGSFGF